MKVNTTDIIDKIVLPFVNKISKLRFLPRWVILLIDVSIISFSIIITVLLLSGLGLSFINNTPPLIFYPTYIIISVISFWIFKTFSGIVRHSSFIDTIRLFASQLFTHAILVFINIILVKFFNHKFCLSTGILINFLISFTILFSFRVFVKYLFEKFTYNKMGAKEKLLLFGVNESSIALANTIQNIATSKFIVNGFVTTSSNSKYKRIAGLPIYELKKSLPITLKILNADGVIFTEDNTIKDDIVKHGDACINYGFKVYKLPSIANLDSKNLASNIKKININDLLGRQPIQLNLNKIATDLSNKTMLVTGAAGSIGSEIVRQLIEFRIERLLILDQAETPLNNLLLEVLKIKPTIKVIPYLIDIRNKKALEQVYKLNKIDFVFHAAAYKHVPMLEDNPEQAILVNVLGTKNVVDLSENYNIEKFVMVSTDKAVNPSSVMGVSKRIAELYVRSKQKEANNKNLKIKYITTRFGNVLGSNGSVVPLFSNQIENGGPITLTHPDIIRYFMTIPEACQLVLEAAVMGNGGEIFLFDMGKPIKIKDLALKMIRLAGLIPEKDIKIKITGLRPGEKLYEELLNNSETSMPTHNKKIMIAKDDSLDMFFDNNFNINTLITTAQTQGASDKLTDFITQCKIKFCAKN